MNRSEDAVDLSLTEIQQKVINVFRPLCRVWQYIEDAKNSSGGDVVIPLHQIAEDMDKYRPFTRTSVSSIYLSPPF